MLADWSFGNVMWAMLVFFAWVCFFWLLFTVWGDLFRRRDMGGLGKAGWIIFTLAIPFLGLLVYFIAYGKGMGDRAVDAAQRQQQQMDDYVRATAVQGNSAEQIEKAKQLLDAGTISQAEFDKLKAQALGA